MSDGIGTATVDSASGRLSTEGADLLTLAGVGDANLLELQKLFSVRVTLRGEALSITGAPSAIER